MGTRNLTLVQSNGAYKVAQYCQWDGYPAGQGKTLLETLRTIDLDSFKEKVDALTILTEDQVNGLWILAGGVINEGYVKPEVAEAFYKAHPHLSRDCGAKIVEMIASGAVKEVELDVEFAGNSLFCEWAYVVDLDKRTFEVFQGFWKQQLADDERFKFLESVSTDGYQPVRLVKSWSLDSLPSNEELLALDQAE